MSESNGSGTTREVANYVASLRYEMLPREVIHMAKVVILDTLGVIVPVPRNSVGRSVVQLMKDLGGAPQARVFGTDLKAPVDHAALANGTFAHDLELDDSNQRANVHCAASAVPAAMAVAERQHCSGKTLVEAVVAAYDVTCRLGIALDYARQRARGFHATSVDGTFGSAMAAGKILGLQPEGLVNALGLAGCQASGTLAILTEGEHFSKSFQTGIPARNGVVAAMLARNGFLGPPAIFEGRFNVFDSFSGQQEPATLTHELGERFEIARTSIKLYPFCACIHAAFECFTQILRDHELRPEEIESVVVGVTDRVAPTINNNPLLTHNAQYVVAVQAIEGDVQREQLSKESKDPRIQDLRRRTRVVVNDELRQLWSVNPNAAIVEVVTRGGQRFSTRVDQAQGMLKSPIDFAAIESKFARLATPVTGPERVARAIKLVREIEEVEDVAEIADLLVPKTA